MVDVSVLVISFNTRELTLACLRSLLEQTARTALEVIVVDNASDDGSAEAIAGAFPSVRLIRLQTNVGFAAANNLAARHAGGDFLLLLNPDTVVLDSAVDTLVTFARDNPQAHIFGGRTVFADGQLNGGSCWRRPTPWSALCIGTGLTSLFPESAIFARESYGAWKRDDVREVDIVSGCFLLIRRAAWTELGGFDPMFFMYGEDADLCLRAQRLGYRCLITPEARIVHYGGASEKVRADKMVKLLTAKAQLFRRHWPAASVPFGTQMLALWALTRMAALGLLRLVQPRRQESFEAWREIWRRRKEFLRGGRDGSDGHNRADELSTPLGRKDVGTASRVG